MLSGKLYEFIIGILAFDSPGEVEHGHIAEAGWAFRVEDDEFLGGDALHFVNIGWL